MYKLGGVASTLPARTSSRPLRRDRYGEAWRQPSVVHTGSYVGDGGIGYSSHGYCPEMEQPAETKDTKIKIKTKKIKLNLFNYLDNLKDIITKMAFLMLILKEFSKDSLLDSAELE